MTDREMFQHIDSRIDELGKRFEAVEKLLTGNGTPERGIIVRMDRLEQAEAARRKWIGAAIGAAVTAVVGSLWALMTGSKP